MDEVRIGVLGLGPRGRFLLETLEKDVKGAKITAYFDPLEARMEMTRQIVPDARACHDEEELFASDCDAVVIATIWANHIPLAVRALNAGKHVGMEVGGVYAEHDLWALIDAVEHSGRKFMLLENVCYMDRELSVFRMVREGLFGELVYATGGYEHDLRHQIVQGRERHHGRYLNFLNRSGDLYPTHQLGPIAKCFGINRGNRILTVSSTASKSRGLNYWAQSRKGDSYDMSHIPFRAGDIVSTNLVCAHGELIHLTHGCSLPRPYSRDGRIQGTKGLWMEDKDAVYFDEPDWKEGDEHLWIPFDEIKDRYRHPLWSWYEKIGVKEAGHGGADYLTLSSFVHCILEDTQSAIDVYDAATWMAVTYLSEESVAMGGAPVPMPDFTRGAWLIRPAEEKSRWMLSDLAPQSMYC